MNPEGAMGEGVPMATGTPSSNDPSGVNRWSTPQRVNSSFYSCITKMPMYPDRRA